MESGTIGWIILGGLAIIAGIIWDASTCSALADAMGINHKWGVVVGCLVESSPGKYVEIDNYRGVAQ